MGRLRVGAGQWDHRVKILSPGQHIFQQLPVKEGHIAGHHQAPITFSGGKAGKNAAQGTFARINVPNNPVPDIQRQVIAPDRIGHHHHNVSRHRLNPFDNPAD